MGSNCKFGITKFLNNFIQSTGSCNLENLVYQRI
ncbi:hypothetical protein ACB092_07G033100 [Castanea dentata]